MKKVLFAPAVILTALAAVDLYAMELNIQSESYYTAGLPGGKAYRDNNSPFFNIQINKKSVTINPMDATRVLVVDTASNITTLDCNTRQTYEYPETIDFLVIISENLYTALDRNDQTIIDTIIQESLEHQSNKQEITIDSEHARHLATLLMTHAPVEEKAFASILLFKSHDIQEKNKEPIYNPVYNPAIGVGLEEEIIRNIYNKDTTRTKEWFIAQGYKKGIVEHFFKTVKKDIAQKNLKIKNVTDNHISPIQEISHQRIKTQDTIDIDAPKTLQNLFFGAINTLQENSFKTASVVGILGILLYISLEKK